MAPDEDPDDRDDPSTVDSFVRKVARVETSSAAFERTIFIGSRIDRYEIVRRLGAGGMGVVYEARDTELERSVALKLVKPRGISLEDAQRRMRREAQAMAKLSSAHTVGIHDIGTHGDKVFIAMELLRGGTLRDWMRTPHEWREIVELFVGVGRGLAAAHSAGLVHRDFKPENVLLGTAGEVRIADFGLARSLGTVESIDGTKMRVAVEETASEIAGTPAYMSPEQLREGPTDVRTDQFSFAVAFYEAIEGIRPFTPIGSDYAIIMRAVLEGEPRAWKKKNLPRWLRDTIMRGLAREPADRWPSMDAMIGELERGLRRRPRWPVYVAGGLAVLAGLAVVLALRTGDPAPPDELLPDGMGLSAKERNERRAQVLFNHAETLYDARLYLPAAELFARALVANPTPAYAYNIARCYHPATRYDDAKYYYRVYMKMVPDKPRGLKRAQDEIDKIDAELAKLR